MKNKLYLIIILFFIESLQIIAQDLKSNKLISLDKIEEINVQIDNIIERFYLYDEHIFKPDKESGNFSSKHKRIDKRTNELKLLKELNEPFDSTFYAQSSQTWYKNNMKDKIEIDIFICPSYTKLDELISLFTTKYYSVPFTITDVAVAGEKSWIPLMKQQNANSSVLMFRFKNIFVKVFVSLENKNELIVEDLIEEIGINIEDKIKMIS